jgi:hypothetical protein
MLIFWRELRSQQLQSKKKIIIFQSILQFTLLYQLKKFSSHYPREFITLRSFFGQK